MGLARNVSFHPERCKSVLHDAHSQDILSTMTEGDSSRAPADMVEVNGRTRYVCLRDSEAVAPLDIQAKGNCLQSCLVDCIALVFALHSQMDSHRSLMHVRLFAPLYHGLALYHYARDHLLDLGHLALAVLTSYEGRHCSCPNLKEAVEVVVEGT